MRPCHLIIAFYASRFLITLPTSGTAFNSLLTLRVCSSAAALSSFQPVWIWGSRAGGVLTLNKSNSKIPTLDTKALGSSRQPIVALESQWSLSGFCDPADLSGPKITRFVSAIFVTEKVTCLFWIVADWVLADWSVKD